MAQAAYSAIVLGAIATLFSTTLGINFLAIAALYIALQFGYSLWARRFVVLDVIAVAVEIGGPIAIDPIFEQTRALLTEKPSALAMGRRHSALV